MGPGGSSLLQARAQAVRLVLDRVKETQGQCEACPERQLSSNRLRGMSVDDKDLLCTRRRGA